ncbi:MAG: transporter substrate-binding domain-containing protein [Sphaerochaeta sp.]|nr:transporter substrate-binding domain-containing protein [Sphaerochaeta sp.]
MRRWIFLALLIASTLGSLGAAPSLALSESEQSFIQAHPTIRLGIDPAFVPFEFIGTDGTYQGISADIVRIITERTGLRFDVDTDLSWQEVANLASTGKIDVLAAVGKTVDREQYLLFSKPYITFQRVIVVKNTNQSIDSFNDLEGRQVAVQANSSHQGLLMTYPTIGIREYDTVEAALRAVNQGDEIAFVGNEATTSYIARANGMTELSFIPIDTGGVLQLHFAVRNDWPELIAIIDKALASISEAEFSLIYNRWISFEQRIDTTPFIAAGIGMVALLLIVFIVSGFWIVRLRREVAAKAAAQRDMEQAKGQAESADQEKSRFMARMSHEIRTPLNGINGMAYLLESTPLDATQKRYVSTIAQASKNMLMIINDIIDYSRIEERSIPLERAPFKLDEVLQHVLSLDGYLVRQKKLNLQFEWDPALPIHVVGDANRFGQIVTNLLHNAIKFTETGTVGLRVTCREHLGHTCRIQFEVRDTGIGMSPQVLENLFKPFSQADASTARKYGGSGLGLSIVKSLVEMMDGSITVESESGIGSVFTVELPFDLDIEGAVADTRKLSSVDFSALNILVVAKDEETRKSIEVALRRFGSPGDYIGSSRMAWTLLHNDSDHSIPRYQLIMIDSSVDGAVQDLLKDVQESYPPDTRPKSVVFVEQDAGEAGQHFRNSGADLVIPKPVLPSIMFNSMLELFSESVVDRTLSDPRQDVAIDGQAFRILVVEDNPVNQMIAREVLVQAGFVPTIAENGKVGCELFEKEGNTIDLILMDLHMDVMDGFEATRIIRKMNTSIPIFATTADVVGNIDQQCRQAGFSRIVPKPYDPRQLVEAILQALRGTGPKADWSQGNQHGPQVLPVLDIDKGLGRVGGNEALYREVLETFLTEHAGTVRMIHEAMDRQDWTAVVGLSHKVKGSSATIGAAAVSAFAAEMQRAAAGDTGILAGLLDRFGAAFGELEREITTFLHT